MDRRDPRAFSGSRLKTWGLNREWPVPVQKGRNKDEAPCDTLLQIYAADFLGNERRGTLPYI